MTTKKEYIEDLENMYVKDLKEIAKKCGIKNYSSLKKDELILQIKLFKNQKCIIKQYNNIPITKRVKSSNRTNKKSPKIIQKTKKVTSFKKVIKKSPKIVIGTIKEKTLVSNKKLDEPIYIKIVTGFSENDYHDMTFDVYENTKIFDLDNEINQDYPGVYVFFDLFGNLILPSESILNVKTKMLVVFEKKFIKNIIIDSVGL